MSPTTAASISITHFSDPGCPWAYSAWPALSTLLHRYGDQLAWRLVLIGLSEDASRYEERGYTPVGMAWGYRSFRDRGMPFATEPRERLSGTGRACRAVVATELQDPERTRAVFRALQFGWFTTSLAMDSDEGILEVLELAPGADAAAIVGAIDDPEVEDAYQRNRAEARTAAGSPSEFQGRTANSDGAERYTAPSLSFAANGTRLEVGGFQPVEAYDVSIANLDPTLVRQPPAEDLPALLASRPEGLTTAEVAACRAAHLEEPQEPEAEDALIALVGEGGAERIALGQSALWRAAA